MLGREQQRALAITLKEELPESLSSPTSGEVVTESPGAEEGTVAIKAPGSRAVRRSRRLGRLHFNQEWRAGGTRSRAV